VHWALRSKLRATAELLLEAIAGKRDGTNPARALVAWRRAVVAPFRRMLCRIRRWGLGVRVSSSVMVSTHSPTRTLRAPARLGEAGVVAHAATASAVTSPRTSRAHAYEVAQSRGALARGLSSGMGASHPIAAYLVFYDRDQCAP